MTITAKYNGQCSECGGKIRAGQQIEWAKGRGARHTKCAAGEAEQVRGAPGPIALGGGSGYGCQGWTVGEVILSSEKRRREGGPDGLVIVTASRRYVREDGLSFGVGDDEGYLYQATARPATPEELAPAIERAQVRARAEERAIELKRIRALYDSAAYLPEDEVAHLPDAGITAETILLDPGPHGGRLWIVVDDTALTLVCGGYYDDYRRSAQRLPRTPELERRVRAIGVEMMITEDDAYEVWIVAGKIGFPTDRAWTRVMTRSMAERIVERLRRVDRVTAEVRPPKTV